MGSTAADALLCSVKLSPYGGQQYVGVSPTFAVEPFVDALGWSLPECEKHIEEIRVAAKLRKRLKDKSSARYFKGKMDNCINLLRMRFRSQARLQETQQLKEEAKRRAAAALAAA